MRPWRHAVASTRRRRRNARSPRPSESLSTVSVTWFDKDAVWRAVEAHAGELPARRPEIEEIRVFGSLVKGTAVPGSDVDLLIILSASERPFPERIAEYLPDAFPCGVDSSRTHGPRSRG